MYDIQKIFWWQYVPDQMWTAAMWLTIIAGIGLISLAVVYLFVDHKFHDKLFRGDK